MPSSVEDIFEKALAAPAGSRRTLLDSLCGSDAALRRQVDRLLRAHERAEGFLGSATSDHLAPQLPSGLRSLPVVRDPVTGEIEGAGSTIGRYRLLELIGEGGFGRVFMAEQTEPVVRRVAVKVVKPGMDTSQILARFEAERQALALMDHDAIARVYDAGATSGGRPYFAMELVAGEPITQFCDEHSLPVPERLDLFRRVCAAVQHAHQKGVIHRDIKPSNILVVERDGRPDPKVIDFGIAKAVSGRLTDLTVYTEFRQFIGTPAYMSPEQCRGGGLDVDTRSDVYSLGVVLYELLTGTTPLDHDALQGASLDEMTEMIKSGPTPRPSTRISSSGSAREVAARRGMEPGRLGSLLKGDLDWIVLKALDKDRARRYDSAAALADDVERYLNTQPVLATPPSAAYRLRKFAARHRAGVIAGSLVALALLLGLAGTSAALVWALSERDRADREARQVAIEGERARETAAFLTMMLESGSPYAASGDDTTLLRRIGLNALAQLDDGAISDHLLDAQLRHTLGMVLNHTGELEQSEALFRQAYGARLAALGPKHPDTILSQTYLGITIMDLGRLSEAGEVIEAAAQAARLGPPSQASAESLDSLVRYRAMQGDLERAEELARESVELWTRVGGPEHQLTLVARTGLGQIMHNRGRSAEAIEIYRELLPIYRRTVGDTHPGTIATMSAMAVALAEGTGDFDEALDLMTQATDATRETFGADHPATINRLANLGQLLTMLERYDEAEKVQREAYEAGLRRFGRLHEMSLFPGSGLASTLVNLGRADEAVAIFEHVVPGMEELLGRNHESVYSAMSAQGNALRAAGRLDEAGPILDRTVRGLRGRLGADHLLTGTAMRRRAIYLIEVGRFEEAQDQLLEAHRLATRARPEHEPEQAALRANLHRLYVEWHKADPAGGHDAQAAQWALLDEAPPPSP